ncbi:AAA family ATPase [Halocola ammonii]
MSKKGSVFQKGGGGTNFEQLVQTAFLTTLLVKGNAPSIPSNEIVEVAFQNTNRGYETDDLLVISKSSKESHRLVAQIKYNLTFSEKNATFNEVIEAFWKDFNMPTIFDKARDKLLIIKGGLNKHERNHIKTLLNWANAHATVVDFISEVERVKVKKECLETFRESIKKANGNKSASDQDLWKFLKCLDLLEYDLLDEASVDEAYFLNLIKLSKNNRTSTNEKEIWDRIFSYVSKLNKDGGSVTLRSIEQHSIYKYFDPEKVNPYFKSIEKLRSDSEVILKPLDNTIKDFHLPRENVNESIIKSINNFDFTMVTGKPGVGKSAAVKEILHKAYPTSSVFVFRADQFNSPHLANVFSSQGVNETIRDIFSCLALTPDKIIVIDSLEKLLEGDPDNAFKQLLALLREQPDIKLIATARRFSFDQINQKFGIDTGRLGVVEVPTLSEEELEAIVHEFPQLNFALENEKLRMLFECPKYLDFAVSALHKVHEDFAQTTVREFKEKLWNVLVKNSTDRTNGLPAKREDAFLNIAVKRAKRMKLFVKPDQADEAALNLLEEDEIIFQENEDRRYSPAHDILEDWALVKYVSSTYEEHTAPRELFYSIGNEPAIRRAFRLWVEDEILDDTNRINNLIGATLRDSTIEQYWADELLTAVFRSDNCSSFFSTQETNLLEDNAILLTRCIHLVRTACKETHIVDTKFSLLLPVGSGWSALIAFINKNKQQLENHKISITNLLFDWDYRLRFDESVNDSEQLHVKEIILFYLKQIEEGEEFWHSQNSTSRVRRLISLVFNLSHISKSENVSLFNRCLSRKEIRENWNLRSFYDTVIEMSLSGLYTQRLTREIPEIIVQVAWQEWKLPKREKIYSNAIRPFGELRLSGHECWGVRDKSSFFPSGIYKTPILNLLYAHPSTGMKFITEFINYTVEFYIKAKCDYKFEIIQLELELNDGTILNQWGSTELWSAYRGLSVTHNAIESVLMSLEEYLLKIAERTTEESRRHLQRTFNYLLLRSNNVAISSVLSSISMAYPKEVGEEMLPLLRVRQFYEWDLIRRLKENSALAIVDSEIPFAQKVRSKSNELPHRKKYCRGLRDFIINYQFNIRELNSEIHEIFDKLLAKSINENVLWKKALIEMDIRNHVMGEYDEKLGGFPVQPHYEDSQVSEFMSSNEEAHNEEAISLNYSNLLKTAYEGDAQITFSKWKLCFNKYVNLKGYNTLQDRPITLAVIGLRDLEEELNRNQKAWCIETAFESLVTLLQDVFNRSNNFNNRFSLIEKEVALKSCHYLFQHISDKEERKDLRAIMINLMIAPFADYEVDGIVKYMRSVFSSYHPEDSKHIWISLIKCAQFRKSNPYFYDDHDRERLKAVRIEEQKFITELASAQNLSLSIDEIDLEKYEGYFLARAFAITPYDQEESIFTDFMNQFIPLLIGDLKKEEDYAFQGNRANRQINLMATLDAQQYLAELLIYADIEVSKRVIDLILDPLYSEDFIPHRRRREEIEFLTRIPEMVIYQLDEVISNSKDKASNGLLISNFWKVWEYIFEKTQNAEKLYLTSILLLSIEWKEESSHWPALEGKRDFYYKMVQHFGDSNAQAIINLFSTAGEKVFLPEGLSWIVTILKKDKTGREISSLTSQSAIRLVKRLFYNHITAIKKNGELISDFIWLLDKMVDLGSSEAYLFRENVISYKQKEKRIN